MTITKKDCCVVYGCANCPLDAKICEKMAEDDIKYIVDVYKKVFPNAKHPN